MVAQNHHFCPSSLSSNSHEVMQRGPSNTFTCGALCESRPTLSLGHPNILLWAVDCLTGAKRKTPSLYSRGIDYTHAIEKTLYTRAVGASVHKNAEMLKTYKEQFPNRLLKTLQRLPRCPK